MRVTLEFAYWLALGIGLGFLALSLLFGDLFDFLDFDIFGGDFAAGPVFFAATGAFGAGGLIALNAFEVSTGVSILAGLGSAALLGGLSAALFAGLSKQEAKESFSTTQLVGARGRCTLAIGPSRSGRVAIQHAGMTRTHTATSTEEIAVGEDIVVLDVVGNSLKVARASADKAAQQA